MQLECSATSSVIEGGGGAPVLRSDIFERLAALVVRESGLVLREAKKAMIVSRLSPRLIAADMPDFQTYCDFVESEAGDAERLEMLASLSTNVTRFFRERHHFETLREQVLPGLIKDARAGGSVRIWSAGCSTGQEAYSIALQILELYPRAVDLDIRILATDLDRSCLEVAQHGSFPAAEMDHLMPDGAEDYFVQLPAKGVICAKPELRDLITFGHLNLIKPWPMQGQFDVIFCRNVVIYFDATTQEELWPRMADILKPGGHLFLGHSERVHGPAEARLRLTGTTQYWRV